MRLNEKIGFIGIIIWVTSFAVFLATRNGWFLIPTFVGVTIQMVFLSYWGLTNDKFK